MAQSFTAAQPEALTRTAPVEKRKVLITGAAGNIGSYFAEHYHDRYDFRLLVRESDAGIDRIRGFGEVVYCELGDLECLKIQFTGYDTIVHLAANADPSALWPNILENNIIGTYNAFVAARAAGCRRVVYASSIHAVSGYPKDVQVKTSEPVNPGDIYGVSKCFGEALARYMAEQEGLSAIALRIGGFQSIERAKTPELLSLLDDWVSHRDLAQLIQRSIDVENLQFAILHGLSDNSFKRLDISDARELVGYEPQDDFNAYNPVVKDLDLREKIEAANLSDEGQKSGIREDVA